jgi:hypothetical protein
MSNWKLLKVHEMEMRNGSKTEAKKTLWRRRDR